jgi:hypothetical protein
VRRAGRPPAFLIRKTPHPHPGAGEQRSLPQGARGAGAFAAPGFVGVGLAETEGIVSVNWLPRWNSSSLRTRPTRTPRKKPLTPIGGSYGHGEMRKLAAVERICRALLAPRSLPRRPPGRKRTELPVQSRLQAGSPARRASHLSPGVHPRADPHGERFLPSPQPTAPGNRRGGSCPNEQDLVWQWAAGVGMPLVRDRDPPARRSRNRSYGHGEMR